MNSTVKKYYKILLQAIETASQDFVNSIKAAISNSSYTPNPKKKKPPNTNPYDLPLNIKILIIEKRRARSRWQHTRLLIYKLNKPKNEPSSYRPISLLPVLGKLFEKVMLKRIKPILKSHKIIPVTQFGFRENHSTTHQIHRIVEKIASSFETKNVCPGVFLDVSQAFDHVWHTGLLFKLKMFLPTPLYLLSKSYLQNRSFLVRQGDSLSSQFQIEAGVPQGSDLSPDLYNIYTAYIPNSENTLTDTYADDTAIL